MDGGHDNVVFRHPIGRQAGLQVANTTEGAFYGGGPLFEADADRLEPRGLRLRPRAGRPLERLDAAKTVDLVFSDIVLPGGMDGIALTREVGRRRPGSKVLLTSGFPGRRLEDAEGLGNTVRLLSKPYRKGDLARAVREALDERS